MTTDKHGNRNAVEGVDSCFCGSKYWENDHCVDCGNHIINIIKERAGI